jgi:hypothetical protein
MQSAEEKRPQGLKPTVILQGLRGPTKGPLFHGDPHTFVSFSAACESLFQNWAVPPGLNWPSHFPSAEALG